MTLDPSGRLVADLRAAVRSVCVDLGGTALVRVPGTGTAWDAKAWSVLSEQVGIAALGLPESVDGVGGVPEIAAVAEQLGAHLLPVPFLTSTVMAGQVLARCDVPGESCAAIASGRETAVLVTWPTTSTSAVPDGAGARWLVSATRAGAGRPGTAGVVVEPVESLDLSRPCARIRLGDVAAVRL